LSQFIELIYINSNYKNYTRQLYNTHHLSVGFTFTMLGLNIKKK